MIVLVGFMGAGKTTVGRLVAERLGLPLVDSDEAIERRVGRTIPEIFAAEGEDRFRAVEAEVVAGILGGPNAVVALGGGALGDARTRAALGRSRVVHLSVELATTLRRVGGDGHRPMLRRPDLERLHAERRPVYAAAATVEVATDGRPPQAVAEEVLGRLAALPGPALALRAVDLDRVGVPVLRQVELAVGGAERWVVLGPNGSGKTTLFQLASGYLHPTRGEVEILGHRLGRVDVRRLRERIGLVSAAVAKMLEPSVTAADVVMSARHGALEPWWHHYGDDERREARALLDAAGFAHVADRPFGVLSEGERQQVLLARSVMARPDLLLLDEPAAGLDVGGRERLVARLDALASDPGGPPMVLITHHVEEIPPGFTHVLLLRDGRVEAAGPLASTLTAEALSATFGLPLALRHEGGRWACRTA